MYFNPIAHPPTLEGDEEYLESASQVKNSLVKKILKINLGHPEKALFPEEYSINANGPPKGRIYEKFPFKYSIEKGKTYWFCTCGFSNMQVTC